MAVVLIHNGALGGALAALLTDRGLSSASPTSTPAATAAAAAAAFATQFLTANAALTAPMADADNANIFLVCYAAAYGVLSNRGASSSTATDYATPAAAAAAAAKAAVASLT